MAVRDGMNPELAIARLREIMIDPLRFSTDEKAIAGYVEEGVGARNLLSIVYPRSLEDIRQVLEVARRFSLSVYTPIPWGLNPPKPGVVMDFSYMADIKNVDKKNLFLQIEPGVTWDQLLPELKTRKVRVALPAAAKSPFVLESAMEREVVLSASRFSNRQVSTFHAVLSDGREYRSGSDALLGSVAHWREDGGPNISRIFPGSRNSFGIPIAAFLFLYPDPQDRKVVVRGLPNRKSACMLARRAARLELGTEVVVLNKHKAKAELAGDPGISTWIAAFGLEGTPRLVKYQEKRIDELAVELKLKPKKGTAKANQAMASALERPWYANRTSIGFYINFDQVQRISEIVEKALSTKGKLAQMLIPVKRGASVYVQFEVQKPSKDARAVVKRLLPRLANSGAFFANPTGTLAEHIFSKQPQYLKLLKEVKQLVDPQDRLNPGQVIRV